jgi:hypothetical protein
MQKGPRWWTSEHGYYAHVRRQVPVPVRDTARNNPRRPARYYGVPADERLVAPPSFRAALVIRNELSRVEREPALVPLTILSFGRRSAGAGRQGARARVEKDAKEGGGEGKSCHSWKGTVPPDRPTPAA